MSAYVLTLLGASLAACMVELLVPKLDGGRMVGHVRMVAGLFLLVILLEPLADGLAFLKAAADGGLANALANTLEGVIQLQPEQPSASEGDYEEVFLSSLNQLGRQETEAYVTETLGKTFSIPPSACAVEAVFDFHRESPEAEAFLREIRIGLKGIYGLEDPHPIEAYFAERLGCPCFVTVVG